MSLIRDLRRRHVFRLAGLYIVGAWIVIEVSSVLFPAWGIPDTALRFLFIAAALLFPVALVFSWIFDITSKGIVRTSSSTPGETVDISLKRPDFLILAALGVVGIAVILGSLHRIAEEIRDSPAANMLIEHIEDSIAVLPFSNLDADPDTGYFSDGVTEEILHRLSATRALHVLGRTSSFAFRNFQDGPARTSEILGVEYLLHGSIRRDQDNVRITARLLDRSGLQVWSQSFDRKLEAIFVIQSEIASAVASQIVKEIISNGSASAARARVSIDAYNEYLIGREFTHARSEDWQENAEAAFRRSLQFDPEYAPALAGLAYSLFIHSGNNPDDWAEAVTLADRALELDPMLAEGYAIKGVLQTNLDENAIAEAEANLRRAIELDPALGDAYNWLADALQRQGRGAEAGAVLTQGHSIDPLHVPLTINLANQFSRDGDFDRAQYMLKRLTLLPNPSRGPYFVLWNLNSEWGRYAEALRWSQHKRIDNATAVALQALGLPDDAEPYLRKMRRGNPVFGTSTVLHMRGEHEDARDHLQAFIDKFDINFSEVAENALAQVVVTYVFAGNYDTAIGIFESVGKSDADTFTEQMDYAIGYDALRALAFALQQRGNMGKALELLEYYENELDTVHAAWSPRETIVPLFLEGMALNRVLLDDVDKAYEYLERAVESGWANYHWAIHDPRWGGTLEEPRFVKLLERVQANLADQRATLAARAEDQQ